MNTKVYLIKQIIFIPVYFYYSVLLKRDNIQK